MVKEYLNQVGGKLTDDVNMFTGGINTYMDKAFINPDQMPYCMNMTMYQPPMMCTRASRQTILFEHPENDKEICKLWAYNDEIILYILQDLDDPNNAKLHAVFKDGNEYRHEKIFNDAIPNGEYHFCYCRTAVEEYLYICTQDYKAKVTIDPSAFEPSDRVTNFTPIEDGHYGIPAFHKGRLFFADNTTNRITFSALWDFDNFTPAPDPLDPSVDYSSYAGDFLVTNSKGRVVSVASFDDKLVIFCEHSMHLLYGDTPLTNSSSQFQLVDMNNNLGCLVASTVAIGGGNLFWLGDDWEIYSFSGSSIDMVSRPNSSRYVQRGGGISNIELSKNRQVEPGKITKNIVATATSDKYCITLPMVVTEATPTRDNYVFVYDIYNKIWWAEDGDLTAIANLSFGDNKIVMARRRDIFIQSDTYNGYDEIWTDSGIAEIPIEYEFHTRVYGVDGVDSRKSLDKVWLQATLGSKYHPKDEIAEANVYLLDAWTSVANWEIPVPDGALKEIGKLEKRATKKLENGYLNTYDEYDYEQQECIVPKLYGQRLNTFQIVIKGRGIGKYYLMKREWRAR